MNLSSSLPFNLGTNHLRAFEITAGVRASKQNYYYGFEPSLFLLLSLSNYLKYSQLRKACFPITTDVGRGTGGNRFTLMTPATRAVLPGRTSRYPCIGEHISEGRHCEV